MVFSSMLFLWVFLPIVICVYCLCLRNTCLKNMVLVLASIIFYAWGEPVYICLLVLSTFVNYVFGILMSSVVSYKRLILLSNVCFNLCILFYFKYCNFLISIVNSVFHTSINDRNLTLPLGISFFTFQAMSYVIDVYRKDCPADRNIINVALYLFFFPQLIAGPIVKYKDIGRQVKGRIESFEKAAVGIRRFCYGLGKKVIISNSLASVADRIASLDMSNIDGIMAWAMVIFYTLQIYYDFSGYSDMAIGLGKIFGFDIEENFQYPYLARSINEFWRKWHISLGTWFRQYVYIPLGGNRRGVARTYVNLFIVFLLTGIWHGSGWNFIFWGAYHGFFCIMERIGGKKVLDRFPFASRVYLLSVVGIGWLFFRFTDIRQGLAYLKRMVLPWQYAASYSIFEIVNRRNWAVVLLAICGCGVLQKVSMRYLSVETIKGGKLELLYCAAVVWLSFVLLASGTYNPFIYFRF